jgi:RNA polymerase sigma factor (sigma-70 family)
MIDAPSLHRFLLESEPAMRELATRLLGGTGDVADVVDEALSAAARRRREVEDDSALEPWLRAIVAGECYRAVARRDRWTWFGPRRAGVDSLDSADPADAESRMHAAVARLEPRSRIAWSLRFQRGWSTREIGDALGLPAEAVTHGLAEALGHVRRQVEDGVR